MSSSNAATGGRSRPNPAFHRPAPAQRLAQAMQAWSVPIPAGRRAATAGAAPDCQRGPIEFGEMRIATMVAQQHGIAHVVQ